MQHAIRAWRIEDAASLAKAINSKKVQDNLRDGLPYPYVEEDAVDFIRATLSAKKDSQYSWAIVLHDEAIGSLGIFRKENIHSRTAELGYFIGEAHWDRGITTCAVKSACQWVFENTDILRIFAEPFAKNTGSCRVLEKAGFQCEGILRKNAVKNGAVLDMKMYALVRDQSL